MPMPCDDEECVGEGMISGDECPGSDSEEEMHHCVDCGQLWWEVKGMHCSVCGDFWCPDWQRTFVFPTCPGVDTDEGVCSQCIISKDEYHCVDKACQCNCKLNEVRRDLDQFYARK